MNTDYSEGRQPVFDADGRLLGWCGSTIDLSNAPQMRPRRGKPPQRLTNGEVWERVSRFLETGDPRHLPPAMRGEASGILNVFLKAAARGKPSWQGPGPEPRPEVPIGESLRIMTGDRADAESEIEQ